MDPKAHYKKLDTTKFPKYFQMGTVVESAADFYSGERARRVARRRPQPSCAPAQHTRPLAQLMLW